MWKLLALCLFSLTAALYGTGPQADQIEATGPEADEDFEEDDEDVIIIDENEEDEEDSDDEEESEL